MTQSISSSESDPRPALAGMACVDTSRNERIPILMEMVGGLSRADSPQDVLREFAIGINQLQAPRGYIALSTRGLEPGEYRITRRMIEDPKQLDTTDPWRQRHLLPVHRGGFLGDLIKQAYPELIHHLDLRDDPVLGDALAPYGSLMAVPLFDGGEPLNWAIMLGHEPEEFTEDDLEEAILRSNLVGTSVRNVLAVQELREAHRRIRQEVDQIAAIQTALLPKSMPEIPGVTLSANYQTYDTAGGDYYDFFRFGGKDDAWGLLMADAAGHGPAAAVMMAMLHAILHAYADVPHAPSVVLDHANRHLTKKGIHSSFVTAIFAIYEPRTRRLTYASAGHPPALVKSPGTEGPVRRLDEVGGLPLGVMDGVHYENHTVQLEPGQTLVLYTDGITESMNPAGDFFGVKGIERALECCSGMPACIQTSITTALLEHEAGVRPSDDQTLVTMRLDD